MIIIDTNIVSEVMRPNPNVNVMRWLNQQDINALYITSVSMAESYFGLYRMPEGKRKDGLLIQFRLILENIFQDRLLGFTDEHSESYAELCTFAEKSGKPMQMADAQIAAIAKFHGATVVTRNTKDFEACGIKLINPFSEKRTS